MRHSAELRRCLETCDTAALRRLWTHIAPHLPQPTTDADALMAIHHARTQASSVAFKLRAYSHRWLLERGYPSALPDALKPKAERLYPRIVEAVGIACKATSQLMQPVVKVIQGAMSDAVMDAYAERKTDPVFVKARMQAARERELKALGLRLSR